MLFRDQKDSLDDANERVDELLNEVYEGWDDPSVVEITLSLEDAQRVGEAFRFLWNAADGLGLFRNIRERRFK